MKRTARSLALKAAYRDVSIGFATGLALTAFRVLTFAGFLSHSPDPVSFLGSLLFAEVLLLLACTVGVYRRRDAAAAALAGLYVLRFLFTWYVSGQPWPPVSFLSLLVAYGLYRGVRGTAELAAMPVRSVPDPAG